MNKELLKAIAIVSVTVIAVTGGIVYTKTNQLPEETKKEVATNNDELFIEEMKTNFISGCYDGYNFEMCDCMFKALLKEYGTTGLFTMFVNYDSTGVMEERAIESIMHCI